MVRPTPFMAALFFLSVPLSAVLLVGFNSSYAWTFVYPAFLLCLFAADFSMTVPAGSLGVDLDLPPRLPLGDDLPASLTLTSKRRGEARFDAKLEFEGELADTGAPAVAGLMGGGVLSLRLPLRPGRRGRLTVKNLWLEWFGPLNLCRRVRVLPQGRALDCVQNIRGLHESALTFFTREADLGLKSQPFRGEGTEFDSLVEYRQGMDNRYIDWKRSARYHKLLAKDFRQERNNQIILSFDTGRLMREQALGLPKLDHYVRAALQMGWVGLLSGDLVGAADFSLSLNSFLKPGLGRAFFSRLQSFTAGLLYHASETNFIAGLTELQGRLARRSLVVVFTEFLDQMSAEFLLEGLALLVRRHVVLFVGTPDPLVDALRDQAPRDLRAMAESVIADSFARDRAVVLERLARLGVQTVDVPPRGLSAAILNRYLSIKQRGLL